MWRKNEKKRGRGSLTLVGWDEVLMSGNRDRLPMTHLLISV